MSGFDRYSYFGKPNASRIDLLNSYQMEINRRLDMMHDYSHPLMSGTYSVDVYEYLKERHLNSDPMKPEDVFDYMMYYFQNLPDWSYPGTMINVIPSINVLSAAVSNISDFFNPNCAQDTYSGNLLLAELEVIKYMSELIGWEWTESTGIFTFGGTGTNLYATKLAIINADPESAVKGTQCGNYFSITSKNGHPCHYQVCDWLGLGSDTCIEIPCTSKGGIDISETSRVVREQLRLGKIFLGFNLTGGSTNEMLIDSVSDIYQLREEIIKEFHLSYRPMIHVDSVLGWVFLFFKNYNFNENQENYDHDTLHILKSLLEKASSFQLADSIGIDFHKTGFCPYVTSLFLVKDKNKYFQLNPNKKYDICSMGYGDYNPFYLSLEYSRSSRGPIAALTCLKSLGITSFCSLIGDLMESTLLFRKELSKDNRILIIDPSTEGFATIFSLIPPGMNITSRDALLSMESEDIKRIKDMNILFGKKIITDCVRQNKRFLFTASRSYCIPGTEIKVGALKAYPMSIFFDKTQAVSLAAEVKQSITELYQGIRPTEQSDFFQDMSRE